MPQRVILFALLIAPMTSFACDVTLGNATSVDLSVVVHGRHDVLGPGEVQRVPLAALTNIAFGAENHEFQVEAARDVLCVPGTTVVLEARADGALWVRASAQPKGLPLRPIRRQDLTAAPPNRSFKPNPPRYAIAPDRLALISASETTRGGSA